MGLTMSKTMEASALEASTRVEASTLEDSIRVEASTLEDGARVVPIQTLDAVEEGMLRRSMGRPADTETRWKSKKCKQGIVLTYIENCPAMFVNHQNSFFGSFMAAYNTHQDVLLAPDDVWLVVCLQFSKYVNKNAEVLRDKLVSHEGQKNLTVTTRSQVSESEWDEFFDLIRAAIKKSTKENVVDALQSDFSTTGLVESMVSTATIMDSFKQYFSYGRCIPLCGIRNVCFKGCLDDWQNLIAKTDRLVGYDVDGQWRRYIEGIRPILEGLLSTYQGNVDVDWWNRIMNMEQGRLGSGSTTYVSGWILRFFGLNDKCEVSDIEGDSIDVPVKIDNKLTGELKTVHMIGGFGGVHSVDVDGRKAFRPQTSMIVLHDPTSEKDLDLAKQHFGQHP